MFNRLMRAFLIILILNLVDAVFCIVWPVLMNQIHLYPSVADTLSIFVNAPTIFTTRIEFNFKFFRTITLIITISILVAYISEKSSDAIIYYEIVVFAAMLSLVGWYLVIKYGFGGVTSGVPLFGELDPREVLTFMVLRLLYHLPLSLIALVIYQVMYRYRMITSEIESLQLMEKITA